LILQYAAAKGQLQHLVVPYAAADGVGRFFQAYLIVDLTMGMLFYSSKVNLLTGWIHHTVYVFIVEYTIQGQWSHIFTMAAVMEIPTFVLALGSIAPHLRSDVLFAVCFFVTRIAFHIALCASLVVQRHSVTSGSLGPAIIMACIFPLHAHWFSGCINGFLKRAKAAEKPVSAAKPPANGVSSERRIMPIISGPVSLYASRMSLARRRTALRTAMRARWDQLSAWKASGRLGEMQRRVRAALPGRERVYQYVGLERLSAAGIPVEQGPEFVREDVALS